MVKVRSIGHRSSRHKQCQLCMQAQFGGRLRELTEEYNTRGRYNLTHRYRRAGRTSGRGAFPFSSIVFYCFQVVSRIGEVTDERLYQQSGCFILASSSWNHVPTAHHIVLTGAA
jgi:hypothetical protein